MIAPANLIGFALAFTAAAWTVSALLCLTVLGGRRRLARVGPAMERVAATGAIVLGPASGLAIVVALAAHSVPAAWLGAADHCMHHGHYPHLCLVHGGAWAQEPWAVAALSMLTAFIAIRLAQKIVGAVKARRGLRRIERLAREDPHGRRLAGWTALVRELLHEARARQRLAPARIVETAVRSWARAMSVWVRAAADRWPARRPPRRARTVESSSGR